MGVGSVAGGNVDNIKGSPTCCNVGATSGGSTGGVVGSIVGADDGENVDGAGSTRVGAAVGGTVGEIVGSSDGGSIVGITVEITVFSTVGEAIKTTDCSSARLTDRLCELETIKTDDILRPVPGDLQDVPARFDIGQAHNIYTGFGGGNIRNFHHIAIQVDDRVPLYSRGDQSDGNRLAGILFKHNDYRSAIGSRGDRLCRYWQCRENR